MLDHITSLEVLKGHERTALSCIEALAAKAPNPRDFRSWDDFYAARDRSDREIGEAYERLAAVRRRGRELARAQFQGGRS